MNPHTPENCERIEAMLPAFVEGGLAAGDEALVRAHVASCASCRESLATFSALEESLVSRRSEVPPAAAFIPALATAPAPSRARAQARPRLVAALRAITSVPGVSIILVVWSAMFLLRFRGTVGEIFTWTTLERLSAITHRISGALVGVSGGDPYTLAAMYVALALLVLGSTGAITLRFIRNS